MARGTSSREPTLFSRISTTAFLTRSINGFLPPIKLGDDGARAGLANAFSGNGVGRSEVPLEPCSVGAVYDRAFYLLGYEACNSKSRGHRPHVFSGTTLMCAFIEPVNEFPTTFAAAAFPSSVRRGGRDIKKISRSDV
jgi:hypothetical protein